MKKLIIIYLIIQLVVMHSAVAVATETNWQLINDEDGIKVYIFDTEYSDIVKAKTQTIINASIEKVRFTLDDINHRHEWIPFLEISKPLTEYQENKRIEYSHFYAPWPASHRDFVYQIELISESDQQLVYKMHSIESDLKPVDKSMIRADLYESTYTLTVLDKETTSVELVFHADPKGWLPNWLINIIQRVLPFKILRNLKSRLNSDTNL
ncbi:MAG: hypothetical protein DIZ80_10225 [endosymbiont of Galathealinum brachiosum]|uniref:START domain-containing protein n=1 Tax=endosymbiont of Galathealinum brachiosum TaxID=2200906 RepID=A0A370DEB7_9GAMM|nr:MAG: hypothetical protein DIZ80_10225 [endosymbiont of Galathealinum brachiosum]